MSRKGPLREVQRANILLRYSEGIPITGIEEMVQVSRPRIYKWIEKALAMGIDEGIKDKYHRPREPVITEEAKAWVINLARKKPTDYGYAAEIWTRSALADHARKYGPEAGHDCLKKAAKATVQRILDEHPIRSHKMAYYLERRDPEFEQKMVDILCVYCVYNVRLRNHKNFGLNFVSQVDKCCQKGGHLFAWQSTQKERGNSFKNFS
jgi:transposase